MSPKSRVEADGVAAPAGHYSHGIVVSGRTLYVAGQVALDEEGHLVGPGDVEAQTRQVLTNMERVVTAAGGQMADVARTTIYLTRLEDRATVGAVRKEFFPDPPPANTLLVVTSLASPDFLVEIDAIVALP
jgi:2-iminobutanoate/2-iminopropanoate deaminase